MHFFLGCVICLLGFLCAEDRSINAEALGRMREEFCSSTKYRALQNALSQADVRRIAMNWDRFAKTSHTFSHMITNELPATSQSNSGRCWLFAALNILRIHVARDHNLRDLELSQSYLFFWDKLEKANYFLESVIETADNPLDSRLVTSLFDSNFLFQDGGQWHMAVNLINKYGIVPQSVFPDSAACLNSGPFNQILTMKLREQGATLRLMIANGTDSEIITKTKNQMIEEIYRMLSLHMGTPPTQFDWEFFDRDQKFHAYRNLTPHSFYKNHVKVDLDEYVCLVHSPRDFTKYFNTFTVKYLGNVIEGTPVLYLNLPMDEIKQIAVQSLKENEPLWFGCDVAKFFHPGLGIMDSKLYDLDILYDVDFTTTKEMRMNYGESRMTHAMVFTGVNLVDDKPTKWRVENSWGSHIGDQGFFVMTDDWFSEYLFEIAVPKKYLPQELLPLLDNPPNFLDPWDPLGSLAL